MAQKIDPKKVQQVKKGINLSQYDTSVAKKMSTVSSTNKSTKVIPKKVTKEQRIKEIKNNPASWSINDYKKFGLPEPGLETPDFDPIDLIGLGSGIKGALGAYNVYKNAIKPLIVKGINIGSRPKSVARAARQIGKSLGGLTGTGIEIAGGTENNYSTNKVKR